MATLEEKRLADLAIKGGLASREQVGRALTYVEEQLAQGRKTSFLDALVTQGILDEHGKQTLVQKAEAQGPIRFGDFEVISLLGQGGMGTVYKAREISLDRICALKLLPAHLAKEPSIVTRFRREAQACAKLDHPNIIRGYRVGEEEEQHYFAMELVEGTSVADMVAERGPLPIEEVVRIGKQIASALAYAHKAGMIHRDIKPENILITRDGTAKLADLGLVKAQDTEQTRITMSGAGMGTPAYMPPEQARGAKYADARSDLYSLGATFYHMVTGRMPFEGDSAFEVLQKAEKGDLKPPKALRPDLPSWLDLTIGKLMQRKPENRIQTAQELLELLERHSQVSVAAPGAVPGAVRPPRKAESDVFWHLRIPEKGGGFRKARATTVSLRQLLSDGKVPLTALAKRGEDGAFKPVNEYPQLIASVTSAKAHADKRGDVGLKAMYQSVADAAARRRRWRAIRRVALRVLAVAILIALAAVAYAYRAQLGALLKGGAGQGP